MATQTCVKCRTNFVVDQPGSPCRIHAGSFAGFERGKLYGGATADFPAEARTCYEWSCCGERDANAPGCVSGMHVSVDGKESKLRAAEQQAVPIAHPQSS